MSFLLDGILILIIIIFTVISAKKGFIKTAIELVGFFLAIELTLSLSGVVAENVYDNYIGKSMTKSISEKVTATQISTAEDTVNVVWDELPEFVTKVAEGKGVTRTKIVNSLSGNAKTNSEIVSNSVNNIARPIIVGILKALLYLVLFTLFSFLIRWIARIVNRIFKLPVIGGVNRFLGGLFGFLEGIVIAAAFCILISICISFTANGIWIFNTENIDNSHIFKFVVELFNKIKL